MLFVKIMLSFKQNYVPAGIPANLIVVLIFFFERPNQTVPRSWETDQQLEIPYLVIQAADFYLFVKFPLTLRHVLQPINLYF